MKKNKTIKIEKDCNIDGTAKIWDLSQIRSGATIESEVVIGRNCFIDKNVFVGKNSKIQNNCLIYEPSYISSGVFIGPSVILTNDKNPRSVSVDGTKKGITDWNMSGVLVKENASIGAGSVCVAPVTIGKWAMVGAGSVVIKNVPDYALVVGNPAKQIGWVGKSGVKLQQDDKDKSLFICPVTNQNYKEVDGQLNELDAKNFIPIAKPYIGQKEKDAVIRVLNSTSLAQGPEVELFEKEFSSLVDGRYCVAVNSGTSALHLSLLAAKIGPGDEVIIPSFTFAATANVVRLCGATPIFCDIDKNFCVDIKHVKSLITKKTKAIMPVHLYGHPANILKLKSVCKRNNILIIEDAAQAHGASLKGVAVGTLGDIACFSFYPTKNMTSGEGGMIVTNSESIYRYVKLLRNQGMEKKYQNEIVGFNNRMTDIHAAIGRVQLKRLDSWNNKRILNAEFLSKNLKNVVVPKAASGVKHVYHQYTILVEKEKRDSIVEKLSEMGIGCGVYYPTPCHRLPSFNEDVYLPNTEDISQRCISLPVHPFLSQADLEKIISSVNSLTEPEC
jgi:dTDP-4-amino-4,6-dideoxygalactose transaminase/acetyltransferase-like isoleucine patch superfamily enzyme